MESYASVPAAETLCQIIADCANESDDVQRAKVLARLGALQAGSLFAGETIDGIAGTAAYFDGSNDHLRAPVFFESPFATGSQSFSFSTWFYAEGNSADEKKGTAQILYSHNAFDERTRFGLLLRHSPNGGMRLAFFEGDVLSRTPSPTEVEIADAIALRTWHSVGFTLDASNGELRLYFDGQAVGTHSFRQPPAAVSCPQFVSGRDIALHEEGDVLGGVAPEWLYSAVNRSNLYAIERTDLNGLSRSVVIGDREFSYRDPDYSAVNDRIVYSSNASGAFEIWMARPDGTGRRQLTRGFGDTERGIAARNPRWAPDGTGIVFESNAYDVLALDNSFGRVAHLYYLGYDARTNAPQIETTAGVALQELDYAARVADQTITDFRVTGSTQDRHHRNAQWLEGSDASGAIRGVLLADTASLGFDGHRIEKITIPRTVNLTFRSIVPRLGDDAEIELLAARRVETPAFPDPIVQELVFYRRSRAKFEPEEQFTATLIELPGGDLDVRIEHTPDGYADDCWDRDFDGNNASGEDRNNDGEWNVLDCYPHDIRNLWVEYDVNVFSPVLEDASGNSSAPGSILDGLNKDFALQNAFPDGRAFVKIQVLSPTNALPIPAGEVARLSLRRTNAVAVVVPVDPWRRVSASELGATELLTKNLLQPLSEPTALSRAGLFESVESAALGPSGKRLLLSVISQSRPLLLRTKTLNSAAQSDRITVEPMRVRGLSWTRAARYYPCNWVGGYIHPQSKRVLHGFRGGLDELRFFSGLQDADTFRSEADRGHERLAAEGRDGPVTSKLPACEGSHSECPSHHLCVAGTCQMVPCDPTDPGSCVATGGRCTIRPGTVEQENVGRNPALFDFVCAADCASDNQCFTQACLNGPCRFCDDNANACMECRDSVAQVGALTIAGIEGCPDRRSFYCGEGACRSECYEIQDDASIYLCDPTTEYCGQGRCQTLLWEWFDLAPASFVGVGTTRYKVPTEPSIGWNGYTQAVGQRLPIKVQAYGVADYGVSPELVVEARGGPFYGVEWNRIARIAVHNRTKVEAEGRPYVVTSEHPFVDLRLRLITSPYENATGAATGLAEKDKDFCVQDRRSTAEANGEPLDEEACYRTAQGSNYVLGYRASIPRHLAIAACKPEAGVTCPATSGGEHDFLHGGNPAVVVMDIDVDGATAFTRITSNPVCSYQGGQHPLEAGVAKKLFYGDIATERSNQANAFCSDFPDTCGSSAGDGLIEFDIATFGHALLNCNVFDPARAEQSAVVMEGLFVGRQFPASQGSVLIDNGDTCLVEVTSQLTQPCYHFTGDDVSLDPMAALVTQGSYTPKDSLEFSIGRGFGHTDGYESQPVPTAALSVNVSGYVGGSGLTLRNARAPGATPLVAVPGVQVLTAEIPIGRRYDVQVMTDASGDDVSCRVVNGSGAMPSGGASVDVVCDTAYAVGGSLSGASGPVGIVLELDDPATPGPLRIGLAREASTLSENGPFSFSNTALPGTPYAVRLVGSPAGQRCTLENATGVVGSADVNNVQIDCLDIAPRALSFNVNGLDGEGLVVVEQSSGRQVEVMADGEHRFDGDFFEGATYGLVVSQQPTNPGQACTVTSDGSGVMPDADTLAGTISCVVLPTYPVQLDISGLAGHNLRLLLTSTAGAETLDVPQPSNTDIVTVGFGTLLVEGDTYDITVATQPTLPDQVCRVIAGDGTVEDEAPDGILILCDSSTTIETHRVGGTVTGLTGTGLQVRLNNGAQTLRLSPAPDGSPWSFDFPVGNLSSYQVDIAQQPSNPRQACELLSDTGLVSGGVVDNIHISCTNASVAKVSVELPGYSGSAVKAMLFSMGGAPELVGIQERHAKVERGVAEFEIQLPNFSGEAAPIEPGAHTLYVFVNSNNSTDQNGRATFDPGDQAASFEFTAQARVSPDIIVPFERFAPAKSGRVFVSPPTEPVVCYWLLGGAGTADLPVARAAPVVAKSFCIEDCDAVLVRRQPGSGIETQVPGSDTDAHEPLVTGGTYDVTCWTDTDGNGELNPGDRVGSETGIRAFGDDVEITMTTQE